ncbi:hypothetical protein T09_990 [Trichinella sp. T9]|nr:hypothetical protein T09_990 [Trichinella sp. T9]
MIAVLKTELFIKHSSSVIYCIMSYFETVLFKQSSTISATSQAEDRQVRITNTCQKSHCAIEDDQPLKCFVSILRVVLIWLLNLDGNSSTNRQLLILASEHAGLSASFASDVIT